MISEFRFIQEEMKKIKLIVFKIKEKYENWEKLKII